MIKLDIIEKIKAKLWREKKCKEQPEHWCTKALKRIFKEEEPPYGKKESE